MTKIIQLTDPHLGPNAEFRLAGIQTIASFEAVLEAACKLSPDLLLVTGDIAADPDPSAYRYFFGAIEQTGLPLVWLPGNHDVTSIVESVGNAVPYRKSYDVGNWRILLLDSVLPDTPDGGLGEDELNLLRQLLEANTQEHVLISVHHHPLPVGSAWIDAQCIADAGQFLDIVEASSAVRGVVWGHIHQVFEQVRGDRLFASAPSTCIQFEAGSEKFALADELPGFRVIELTEQGEINTEVRRVQVPDFKVSLESQGY